ENTMNLDQMSSLEIITEMNREDALIASAIQPHLPNISKVIEYCIKAISQGGRIIYMGAGTSGRLGVLDAAECPPTFGVSPDVVVGLIAGGEGAFIRAREGSEDSVELGKQDLIQIGLNKRDIVIGLAASGRTPYVLGGLAYAQQLGCHTAAISNTHHSKIGEVAEIAVDVPVGAEVLTGSTRLKSGTAEKMILNMISTATMVGLGKAYQNLMVDVMQTNEKLRNRAENIVMEATGVERSVARATIDAAKGSCKVAITMILANCSYEDALMRLQQACGHVREAIMEK
ncbi:N-acetylmuramic acid 6-phosphate etherase, partial [uncultured Solobacterium sp.]